MGSSVVGRKSRMYHSPLRKEKAEETKERILDGLVKVMARDGISDISIPLVAREAGVSVPSVYRYYPTKRELIGALDEYAHRKGAFTTTDLPQAETPEELARIIPIGFKRREAIESTLSAAMNSSLGYAMRRPEFAERSKFLAKAFEPATANLSKKEKQWLADIVLVLGSFAAVRAFRDYLGLNTDEAGKRVAWAIRVLARGARTMEKTEDNS
jgi:AcrR family transcriptional regulator